MPKTQFTGSAAVLLVRDVLSAANEWRDKLGFTYERFYGEPPSFVILRRDGVSVMLKQVSDPTYVVPHSAVTDVWDAYFWVSDVEGLYAELTARGATIDYALCDQSYGCREFAVQVIDKYSIAFGQPIA